MPAYRQAWGWLASSCLKSSSHSNANGKQWIRNNKLRQLVNTNRQMKSDNCDETRKRCCLWGRFRRDFRPTGRHVCVFVDRWLNRWRRCSCWSCRLCIHTGHELDCSRHWPVHVCPAVFVHWSPVDWCWPVVQSVPPTTTDVIVIHIELVVCRCLCSLTMIGCVGAVQT